MSARQPPPDRRSTRWWPAALVLVLGAAALAWIWGTGDRIGQQRVIPTFVVLFVTAVGLVVWAVFLSHWPRRARAAVFLGAIAVTLAATGLLRIRGVTGDLVPLVSWRWQAGNGGPPLTLAGEPALATRPSPESARSATPTKAASAGSATADYPQFLGPNRDAVVRGLRLARDWRARPPREVWRRPVGEGWSSFAVAGDLAVTQEQAGAEERVVAYDWRTGRPVWTHADRARYETTIAGIGPRATPTIASERVYAMGATGLLNALDLTTGRLLWQRNVTAENGAENPEWGKSCSPLIAGDVVVLSAGGPNGRSLVAYDRETGVPRWRGGGDRSAYASPLLARLAGVEQIVILNRGSVAAHDPETGEVLWKHPWPAEQPNVAQPVPLPGDRLLVSSGYGIGSKLFEILPSPAGRLEAVLLWESPRLKAKFTNLVLHEGFVYGLDDGTLACLDPATGERRWRQGRYGHGQILLVENLLLVQAENGDVALVEPHTSGLRELGRFAALSSKTWNNPALAGPYLLVRNDREAACFELPVAP